MSDFAVQGILDLTQPVDAMLRALAQRWPKAQALEVGLAVATACDAIEQMYVGPPPMADRVMRAWRLAALIGGDVLALQSLGRRDPKAVHLLAWWDAPGA